MNKVLTPFIALLLILNTGIAFSQQDSTDYAKEETPPPPPPPPAKPKPPIKDKIYFGGNLGLSFGTVTSIAIEPLIGWKWTPKLSSGLVLSYWYYKDTRYIPEYESSSFGYRIFSRYRIIPQIYGHVEFAEFFYDNIYNPDDFTYGRASVPYLFVGGGLSQPMGTNAHFFVQVLYEVIQDSRSIYAANNDLYVSIGVAAGF